MPGLGDTKPRSSANELALYIVLNNNGVASILRVLLPANKTGLMKEIKTPYSMMENYDSCHVI
jgi:hypothetical protein